MTPAIQGPDGGALFPSRGRMRFVYYLLPRVAIAAFTLLGVSILIFVAMRFVPGGFEDMVLGPLGTPEQKALVRARYGLDQPMSVQYVRWLGQALAGDFGMSLVTHASVAAEIGRRAPTTLQLAAMSGIMALGIGIPLGVASALTGARRRARVTGRIVGSLGASVPDFVLGTVLVFVFTVWSLGLTVGGFEPLFVDPLANLRAMILPALTLGVFGIALVLRTTRDAVLNVMTDAHITAAVARGETTWEIVRHHVLRNAAVPVVTVFVIYIGYFVGSAVIAERLFSIPGVGHYLLQAINNRDYGVVQAATLLAAAVFVGLNTFADVLYAILDPRIGTRRGAT